MFSEFQWKLGFSITTPCRSQFEVAVLIKSGNYIVPGPSTPLLINKGPHLLFCYIFPLTLKNSLFLIYFFVYHILSRFIISLLQNSQVLFESITDFTTFEPSSRLIPPPGLSI